MEQLRKNRATAITAMIKALFADNVDLRVTVMLNAQVEIPMPGGHAVTKKHDLMPIDKLWAHAVISNANCDRVTFNISFSAIKYLIFFDDHFSFEARFRGTPTTVIIPYNAVMTLWDNNDPANQIVELSPFLVVHEEQDNKEPAKEEPVKEKPKGSHLRVVK